MNYEGNELGLFRLATTWKRYFRSILGPYLGQKVLETGAGVGGTTAVLCRGTEESWVCLEPDPHNVAELERLIAQRALPACCRVRHGATGDLESSERFDTVLYVDVLEHIGDDAGEAMRAEAHLADHGRLVIVAPAHNWLMSEFDRAIGHYRRYSRVSLRAVVPRNLICERLLYLDSVGLLASLANKALLRQAVPSQRQVLFWDRCLVPLSRVLDKLIGHSLGKSVVGVWKKA